MRPTRKGPAGSSTKHTDWHIVAAQPCHDCQCPAESYIGHLGAKTSVSSLMHCDDGGDSIRDGDRTSSNCHISS